MAYRKETLLKLVEDASKNMDVFYQQNFLNWRGRTSDTKEPYTGIISVYLLEHKELLDGIQKISRLSYLVKGHDGAGEEETCRKEEHLAMALKAQRVVPGLGEVLEYQVPLKRSLEDQGVGKIDLTALAGETLYVLELKKQASKETMLRSALEAYTYTRQVDGETLLREYGGRRIAPAVLVFRDSAQHDEWEKTPEEMRKLFRHLGISIFWLRKEGERYLCERDEDGDHTGQ